ncbi:MAG TPA: hypothetical protein VF092_01615 [Longimicrobium sp.]
MEERIRVPGGIASLPDDELDLEQLDQVAGGLARAWPAGEPADARGATTQPAGTPIRG